MLKEIIQKFFCIHEWNTHTKDVYTWSETKVVKGTEFWFRPMVDTNDYSKTVETLICKKCGKLHTIHHDGWLGSSKQKEGNKYPLNLF